MLGTPATAPAVCGWNDTLMLQLDPGLSVAGQLFVWTNPALMLMLEIAKAAGPLEVSLTVLPPLCLPTKTLPNDRLAGDSAGAPFTPLPDKAMFIGLAGASLVILSVAEPGPSERGVNPTWIVQLPPGAVPAPPTQLFEAVYRSG